MRELVSPHNLCRLLFLTAFGFSACATPKTVNEEPLFSYDGIDINRDKLPEKTKQDIFDLEMKRYEEVRLKVQEAILELYFAELAKQQNTTPEAVQEKLIGKGYKPSEEEMQDFYKSNKDNLPYSYDQVKGELQDWLVEEMKKKERAQLLTKIEKEKNVLMYFRKPIPPTLNIDTKGAPRLVGQKAKIVLVEFGDFLCPYCKKASSEVKKLLKAHGDQIEFVFMFFPMHAGDINENFARGGYCAWQQDRFWQYHDYVFENQLRIILDTMPAIAKKLKLKEDPFLSCIKAKETIEFVKNSFAQGRKLGVKKTPTFFLDGRQVVLEPTADNFASLVNEQLRKY